MPYAIMQKEIEPPTVELMKKAFQALPHLTALDAQTVANDAFGILLRGLDVETASSLQDALFKAGVETVVVEESELPVNPPAKLVKQLEFLPKHVVMYDPLNRSFNLNLKDIMLLAAGRVIVPETRKSAPSGTEAEGKEEPGQLLLEIVLAGGVARYSINAEEFVFNHLGARLTRSLPHNFALLVRELAEKAPHAGQNRGAFQICNGDTENLMLYPNKTAFFEEITWFLWRVGLGTG